MSDGEYISLGWYERDDLAMVIEYLRSTNSTTCIGLWGRSMGAVTALLHADRDLSIACMILDSPFTSLTSLAEELAAKHSSLPGFILKACLSLVRSSIKSRADFDINLLRPIDHVEQIYIPALFGAAKQDDFVKPTHSQQLFAAYAGDKNIIYMDGDHNSSRPQSFLDNVAHFLYSALGSECVPQQPSLPLMDPEEVLLRNVIAESLKEAQPGLSDEEYEQLCEESFNVLRGM
jgi:pimeloyl-ACP methyl ester carboxylesterase